MSRIRKPHAPETVEERIDAEEDEAPDDGTPDEPMEGETEAEAQQRVIDKYMKRARSPLKAIRAFCIICMGGQVREVARCTAGKTCVLYPMRMGRNPFQSGSSRKPPKGKA